MTKAKSKKLVNETETVPQCPECNSTSIGQVDIIFGVAAINAVGVDGTVEFEGETEVNWDSQRPAHNPVRWECMDCGHQAPRSKFLPKGTKVVDE